MPDGTVRLLFQLQPSTTLPMLGVGAVLLPEVAVLILCSLNAFGYAAAS